MAPTDKAREDLSKAALRQEAVFLSYSGTDVEAAGTVAAELKRRFQQVFDYRDGTSITPGQPWLQEVFDRLSLAGLGVLLLSEGYLASGNCLHEAREMVARADARQMVLVPVVVRREKVAMPSWLGALQVHRRTGSAGRRDRGPGDPGLRPRARRDGRAVIGARLAGCATPGTDRLRGHRWPTVRPCTSTTRRSRPA